MKRVLCDRELKSVHHRYESAGQMKFGTHSDLTSDKTLDVVGSQWSSEEVKAGNNSIRASGSAVKKLIQRSMTNFKQGLYSSLKVPYCHSCPVMVTL